MTKHDLYLLGIEAANQFLDLNGVERPTYMTYEEADSERTNACLFLHRVTAQDQRRQGAGTGLYYKGHVFVNVPVTALPVQKPVMRSWSWPGYKVDRTAMGVVAHEVGHHVAEMLNGRFDPGQRAAMRNKWLRAIKGKRVSGYEPVPGEAGAETMRLFILNPDLLRRAIPSRYAFTCELGLRPVPALLKKGWRKVLANKNYEAAAERWIGVSR